MTMGRRVAVARLPLLFLTASCQTSDVLPPRSVQDSAGIQIVTNTYVADGPPSSYQVAPAPSADIGSRSGDPAHQLFGVRDARKLPDRTIVVLDEGSKEVRFVDSRGSHLRTVGREGEGPGKYRAFASLTLVGPDSLLVYDYRLGRVTVVDLDGVLQVCAGILPNGPNRRSSSSTSPVSDGSPATG